MPGWTMEVNNVKISCFGGFILLAVLFLSACGGNSSPYPPVYHYETKAYDKAAPHLADLIQLMEDGFFANFSVTENGKTIYPTFTDMLAGVREAYTWAAADLSGDGIYELIMQAQDSYHPQKQRIISIFVVDFSNQAIARVFLHDAGLTRFWFLGENGNLVFWFSRYGPYAWWHSYTHMVFDENWQMQVVKEIRIVQYYPQGYVSFFEVDQGRQPINRQAFWGKFMEITGFYFLDVLPAWYIQAATFVSVARVHEDMPLFYVYRTIMPEGVVEIRITDGDGNWIQTIDGIMQSGNDGGLPGHLFEVGFDDFNFDGYMDMWLVEAINRGTAGGQWGYFWLWDPEVGQFVQSESLQAMTQMAWFHANQDTRQMEIHSRGGGSGPWRRGYYVYEDGAFALVASVLTEWVGRDFVASYMQATYTNHITGEVARAFDPPSAAPTYTIYKSVDINPYMEFPTHEVRLDMWPLPEDSEYRYGGYQYEVEITIAGYRRFAAGVQQSRQTIRGLRAGYGYGRWTAPNPKNPLNLHFRDFNGNGYLDMALRRSPPQAGHMADDGHYFWLFNPEADGLWGAFERNDSLEYAASFGQVMDVDGGYVRIFLFHGLQSHYLATYVYADGEFVFVSIEDVSPGLD